MTQPLSWTIHGNDQLSSILEKLDRTLDGLAKQVDKVSGDLRGMGREMDAAEEDARRLGQETEEATGRLDEFGDGMANVSGKVRDYGMAMTAAAAAAVTAIAAVGVAFAAEKSKSDALLAAQVGATPEQAKELGRATGQLYAQGFAESAVEASDAIRAAIQNQLAGPEATAEALTRIGARVSVTSALMRQDVDRVASAISQMLRTGLAKSADEAFDLIVAATQRGIDKSGDLLDTLNEYSTQFRAVGVDAHQALGMMAQALEAGARDSDTAADAIKEFAIRSRDGSALSASAFKALGLDAKKMFETFAKGGPEADLAMTKVLERLQMMEDPVARNATAVALFGTKAEDLQDALFAFDPTTAVDALGKVEGATQDAIDAQVTGWSRLESSFKGVQERLANMLSPAIEGVLDKIDEWAQDPEIQKWLADLRAELGEIAKDVLPLIKDGFQFFMDAIKDNKEEVAVAIKSLTVAVGLLVVGLIVAGGVAVHAASLMQNSWQFTFNAITGYMEFFITAAAKAFSWVPELGPKLQQAADDFSAFRDNVNNALDGIEDEEVIIRGIMGGALAGTAGGSEQTNLNLGRRAAGGPVWPDEVYTWREQGVELLTGASGRVMANQEVRSMMSRGGGGGDTLTLRVIHETPDGRVIREELLEFKRQRGLTSLGLA